MIELPRIEEIRSAQKALEGVITRTPLVPLHQYEIDQDLLLKPEILQPVGSFKIRGVFYAVSKLDETLRDIGVCTVSAGNTAQALAWAARYFDVPARSIMPDTAPIAKIEAVRSYGATPVLVPVDEVFSYLQNHVWEQEPFAFVHPWTDRSVMIGHGSIGLEIYESAPSTQTVFIPVGGGALAVGVGAALKALDPSIRVIGVEPTGCPALFESLKKGSPTQVPCSTICDGVAVPYITEELFPLLQEVVDEVVLVTDEHVKKTIKRLALRNKMVVEPSGALSVAAASAIDPKLRGRTVCLVTGGSIDTAKLLDILIATES